MSLKVLVIDDHKLIRDAIISYFEDDSEYEVVGEASNGNEGIAFLNDNEADIALVDINMPEMNGIEATKIISKQFSSTKVLALTMMNDNQHVKKMMNAGASGYVLKNCSREELITAMKTISTGDIYYSPEVTQTVMQNLARKKVLKSPNLVVDMPLTDREIEVLGLIVKEYSNQEIADTLFISLRTVDAHKRNLLEKTGSKNTAGLVLYAVNRQLFDDI